MTTMTPIPAQNDAPQLPRALALVPHLRRRALKKVALGLLLAVVAIPVIVVNVRSERPLFWPVLGIPLLPLFVGLLELVTGRSFAELSQRWDELRGWQRAVIGLLVVAATGLVLCAALAFLIMAVLGEP